MRSLVWENSYSFRRFLRFYIQRKFISVRLYQSCVARISAHTCVWSAIMIFILSLWIAFSLSEQLKIDRTEIIKWNWSSSVFSGSRENQNTIKKNEFYEWKKWRTIMKTMSENNFICIKINSWLQYDKISSAFFFIKRSSFYQSFFFIIIYFNSWPPPLIWSDQTEVSSAFISIIDFIQINISTADFSKSTRTSSAFRLIIDSYRSTSDQLVALLRQSSR